LSPHRRQNESKLGFSLLSVLEEKSPAHLLHMHISNLVADICKKLTYIQKDAFCVESCGSQKRAPSLLGIREELPHSSACQNDEKLSDDV
jgi:hypothetical protein